MAATIKAKVADGEYATESKVIRDGLRVLIARDQAIDAWLREQVVPTAVALDANPAKALTANQVRERLLQWRRGPARTRKA